jgi:hypothetical protein
MKHKLFLAPLIVIFSSFVHPLKEVKEIATPAPFAYQFGIMDPQTGKAKAGLEQSAALIQTAKSTATTLLYTIAGTKSSIRLNISNIVFQAVADASSAKLDPSYYIYLYKLSGNKANRILTVNSDGSSNAMMVPVTISLFERTTYKIIVGTGWAPGEYAFIDKSTATANGNVTVWTFGID